MGDQLVELLGNAVDELRGWRNIFVQSLHGNAQRRIGDEWSGASKQLKEQNTRRIHIGGRGDGFTRDLLRSQISDGADDDRVRGHLGISGCAHQTEVRQLHSTVRGNQHIFWLDISVHHAARMRHR